MPIKMMNDKIFKGLLLISACLLIAIASGFFITTLYYSQPALFKFGFNFFTGTEWNPVENTFGVLPFVIGTLATSFIALLIAFPISTTIAIFLGEYFRKGMLNSILKTSVELLAGIPSIIYGFWGLFIFVPLFREIETAMGIPPYGVGITTSAIILAIMIVPYSASITREVIMMVPKEIKEAAYSLGATRFEMIAKTMLPYSSSGILAGVLLALGRALGETMAVTMVIGNSNILPKSIFGPGNTMASIIANEFTEATSNIYLSSLIGVGLILFLITTLLNLAGKYLINKLAPYSGGAN